MIRAVLLDYGAGNLCSLARALATAGAAVAVREAPGRWDGEVLVLPGVGHFGAAARRLRQTGLWEWVAEVVAAGAPLVGVCLGMQLLYRSSEESPGVDGLGLLRGTVRRLPEGVKVPHMGWNLLRPVRASEVLEGITDPAYVYYAHSYAAEPCSDAVAVTEYGAEFAAVVRRGAVVGLQFHPEKSGSVGLRILHNALHALAASGAARSGP